METGRFCICIMFFVERFRMLQLYIIWWPTMPMHFILASIACALREDMFGRSSFWIVGGDGWAYDIGYGGLDHVIASEEHVNILVLDTEMYSNTGGQASKATPKGAMAKFAEGGKLTQKKDMGQLAMTYKNVYVASICVHVNPQQAVRAMIEADAYPGPSIILAYSPCISQGFPMAESIQHCQMAVDSGYWPLYRYNPDAAASGNNPFQLDSRKIKGDLFKFLAKDGFKKSCILHTL